jgi:hypothetical protein
MKKVETWMHRAGFQARAAARFVCAAAALSTQLLHGSAQKPKPPVDYLARVGPMPLRFETQPISLKQTDLPPLNMGSRTKENTNTVALSRTNALPTLAQVATTTNKLVAPRTNAALPSPLVSLPLANLPTVAPQSTDTSPQLFAAPFSANDSVLTPQMLVHFFQKNGTNGGTSVTLPVNLPSSESSGKSSSATYVSP